jgi:pimeloyl-ACP methyl ester carboxylesterase
MPVFAFHLMPWPNLPEDIAATHDTAWVVCENSLFDNGHEQLATATVPDQRLPETLQSALHAHAAAYAEGLPDARVELIEGAGHYPYLERTDEFLQVVKGFFAAGG